jgi:nucleoid-associated protein YgaU
MPNKKEYTEMTADAKVGLLLGLVLIAFIVFAINGLPDFIPSAKNTPVVETAVTTQTSGNLVIEPAVVDVARNLQEKRTSVHYVTPPSEVIPLDEYAGGLSQAPAAQKQTASNDTASSVLPAAEVKEAAKPDTKVAVIESQTQQPDVQKTEQVQKPNRQEVAAAPKTVAGANHVVEEGDSLAFLAKKYYGIEEGNKRATIQMLYEANKDVLESPDKIQVGDKLVIPKVASAATEQAAPAQKESAVSTSTLLDKFKNVFMPTDSKKNNPAVKDMTKEKPTAKEATKEKPAVKDVSKEASKEKPIVKNGSKDKNETSAVNDKKAEKTQPSKGVTEYTVQSGDHLYKIAQKFLGDGDRYPELMRLNNDVLSGSDHLEVGMKLKVPKP